jgi:hypothetical protein
MKFAYVDESGSKDEGDVFVMVGLLVDGHRLAKLTRDFDQKFKSFCAQHPNAPDDFKTKRFINGRGGWNNVSPDDRKQFLREVVGMVADSAKIYAYGMSFEKFDTAVAGATDLPENQGNYWTAAGMFVASLIQKKMQKEHNNKGLTVLVFDDNKADMPRVSEGLYKCNPWYDDLYALPKTLRGKTVWQVKASNRFDHIINTAFALKSNHSSLVQVADALSYIYRRHLELTTAAEAYAGEKAFYTGLVETLETLRQKLGRTPTGSTSVAFYESAAHEAWDM